MLHIYFEGIKNYKKIIFIFNTCHKYVMKKKASNGQNSYNTLK